MQVRVLSIPEFFVNKKLFCYGTPFWRRYYEIVVIPWARRVHAFDLHRAIRI